MGTVALSKITKQFGTVPALHEISLDIRDGEFLTLLGPSGCGKSTLLRIVAGLEQQSGGTISIKERCVDDVSPRDRGVAMVFQNYALYPHLPVAGNIAAPLYMRRMNRWQRLPLIGRFLPGARKVREGIASEITAVSEMLGISHLLDRKPSQISGGQRQRVALGRAMVRRPDVFLMDEPLANLDSGLRAHMRGELSGLHRRLGVTFIYVTHDQIEAMTMSDRIAVIFDGVVRQIGTPSEIYRRPEDLEVAAFMTQPQLNRLSATGLQGGTIKVCGTTMAAPSPVPAGAVATLAFRPEDGRLAYQARERFLEVVVDRAELLGSDALVYLTREDLSDPILVRVESEVLSRLTPGTRVWVAPDTDRGWCFDNQGQLFSSLQREVA